MRTKLLIALTLTTSLIFAAAASGQPAGTGTPTDDAWAALTATRNALAHAAIALPFDQTFVPAGFNSGDHETGVASFGLPDCVRWDYLDPDPRSYLLCGDTVLTWNQGEDSGRRQRLDDEESGPFELWLAPLSELARRYSARLVEVNGDHLSLTIQPTRNADFDSAEILVDRETRLPVRFEYRDFEGNLTTFDFGDVGLLDADDSRFDPPPLEWIEE